MNNHIDRADGAFIMTANDDTDDVTITRISPTWSISNCPLVPRIKYTNSPDFCGCTEYVIQNNIDIYKLILLFFSTIPEEKLVFDTSDNAATKAACEYES